MQLHPELIRAVIAARQPREPDLRPGRRRRQPPPEQRRAQPQPSRSGGEPSPRPRPIEELDRDFDPSRSFEVEDRRARR
jgi:hypothetical protein